MPNGDRGGQLIFTDLRHIRCGDLEWFSPAGEKLPLIAPPPPPVDAHAGTGLVPHGIRLVAQPAIKTEPLLPGTRLGRVVLEDGLYRSWYLDARYPPGRDFGSYSTDRPESVAVCATESRDGFAWSEPTRHEFDAPGQTGLDGFCFFVDPHGPEEERFKAVYTAIPPETERPSLWERFRRVHPRHRDSRLTERRLWCMYGLTSPDGARWTPIGQPLMVHLSDTDTSVYYDPSLERYVMYTRLYRQDRRWVGRAEGEDFRAWSPVEPLIWPSLDWRASDDIYTNGRTAYPGLPEQHLMFPMVYHRHDQTSDVRLFSSADGVCWNPVPGEPVLTPGQPGAWDSEFIHAGKDLVPLAGDRVGLPYHGTSFPHKYPRWPGVLEAARTAWAWWPRGRICAIVADGLGEFFTVPLRPTGRELRVNARVRRGGDVRVGLLGVPDRTIDDCDPLHGDGPAMPLRWRGVADVGTGEEQTVTLQVRLRSAALFGIEWV